MVRISQIEMMMKPTRNSCISLNAVRSMPTSSAIYLTSALQRPSFFAIAIAGVR